MEPGPSFHWALVSSFWIRIFSCFSTVKGPLSHGKSSLLHLGVCFRKLTLLFGLMHVRLFSQACFSFTVDGDFAVFHVFMDTLSRKTV
jgi:hypothetical protein